MEIKKIVLDEIVKTVENDIENVVDTGQIFEEYYQFEQKQMIIPPDEFNPDISWAEQTKTVYKSDVLMNYLRIVSTVPLVLVVNYQGKDEMTHRTVLFRCKKYEASFLGVGIEIKVLNMYSRPANLTIIATSDQNPTSA